MTVSDRLTIASADTRSLRRQLEAGRSMLTGKRSTLAADLPSYVAAALAELEISLDRWRDDERAIDAGAANVTIPGSC